MMENTFTIILDNDPEFKEMFKDDDYSVEYSLDNFGLNIAADVSDDILESEEVYQEVKRQLQKNIICFDTIDEDTAKIYRQLFYFAQNNSKEKFYDLFTAVKILGDIDDIIDFVNNHPKLIHNRSLILGSGYEFSKKGYETALSDVTRIKAETPITDISMAVGGNLMPITIDDFSKSFELIDSIVKEVEFLPLSPLEQIMYVYDIIKNRVYHEESKDQCPFISRDLVSSLLNEEIVCAGFSKNFIETLDKLGINATTFDIRDYNGEDVHVRALVAVEDKKYDVDGLYLFDPTWDSKQIDAGIESMNSYFCFARTIDEMSSLDRENDLVPAYNYFIRTYLDNFKDIQRDFYTYDDILKYRMMIKANTFLELIGEETVNMENGLTKKEIYEIYIKLIRAMSKPISKKTMLEVIYNVRKQVYYLKPETTPFNIEDLETSIFYNKFKKFPLSSEDKLLAEVYGETSEEYKKNMTQKFVRDNLTEEKTKEIEAIKLTRVLRDVLINKQK